MERTKIPHHFLHITFFVGGFILYCLIITCIIMCLNNKKQLENLSKFQLAQITKNKKCLGMSKTKDKLQLFDDILKSKPANGTTIFFHHASCSENGHIRYTFRYLTN